MSEYPTTKARRTPRKSVRICSDRITPEQNAKPTQSDGARPQRKPHHPTGIFPQTPPGRSIATSTPGIREAQRANHATSFRENGRRQGRIYLQGTQKISENLWHPWHLCSIRSLPHNAPLRRPSPGGRFAPGERPKSPNYGNEVTKGRRTTRNCSQRSNNACT